MCCVVMKAALFLSTLFLLNELFNHTGAPRLGRKVVDGRGTSQRKSKSEENQQK